MNLNWSNFEEVRGQLSMIFAIFLGYMLMLIVAFLLRTGDDRTRQAEESYRAGESATTLAARQEAFNRALDLFLTVEAKDRPYFGSGYLYYDIGNTYFQLGQYPLAILNYLQAKNLMPREDKVERNLSTARNKLALTDTSSQAALNTIFFTRFISLPERLQLFFLACLIALLLCSGWIWTRGSWYWNGAVVALSTVAILALSLGYTRYVSPVHAVLVHAVELRRDAGTAFAKVNDVPIPAGTVVSILDTSSDAAWLKISAPGGQFGYAPQESVGIIRS